MTVGTLTAAGMILVGLFGLPPNEVFNLSGGNLSLMLVGGVVLLLGRAELAGVEMQEARRRQVRGFADFFTRPTGAHANQPADAFTGWRWDPIRRVWSEWRNGSLVREIAPT